MVTVREHARLTTDEVTSSIDCATVPKSAFDWLAQFAAGNDQNPALVKLEGPRALKVRNYVGVVETPCGTQIEILPKHARGTDEPARARRLLVKLISEALTLKPRIGETASIQALSLPMTEWLAAAFLEEALALTRRGLRQDYQRVEAREPFLRGQLDVARQIHAAAAGAHMFNIRHDEFSFNRPENRIIRSAVEHIAHRTASNDNWKLARELSVLLADDVPTSRDIAGDLQRWRTDRHLADYARIKPLCELLLTQRLPFSVSGAYKGISMLFPMERLFERYVLNSLRAAVPSNFKVFSQSTEHHLCSYEGDDWFQLKPDIIVTDGSRKWIVDAKWKRLSSDRGRNYDLRQSDFYQLYVYGQKYLDGVGDMYLVYPKVDSFPTIDSPFKLSEGLNLYVLPFELDLRYAAYPFLL